MDSAKCPSQQTIAQWAQGLLDDETADLVADHLDVCEGCEKALEKIEAGGLLKNFYAGDKDHAIDAACREFVGGLQHQNPSRKFGDEETVDSANKLARESSALAAGDTAGMEVPSSTSHAAVSEQQDPTLPCRFGDYELLKELGKGGMGVVYQARQLTADRMVALKLIRPDQLSQVLSAADRRQLMTRFRNEVQAASKIEHDHVVSVYDVGDSAGQLYYAMRLVDGESLRERLDDGPLEPLVAARYTEQIAQALADAHAIGILHRDVKPHNVLVDGKTDRALLADFGLAKLTSEGDQELTATAAVLGSPPYMSPEQTIDSGKVTYASDIYGLGATLYHLLTGETAISSGQFDHHHDSSANDRAGQPA